VKVLVARKVDALIEAGGEGGRRMMLRDVPLDAFSTLYSFWAALAGYEGPKWKRLTTKTDEDEVLSLRDETGNSIMHWALSDDSRATLAEVIALRDAGRVADVRNRKGDTLLHLAADKGLEVVVRALVAAGTGKEVKNRNGDTPLLLAVRKGFEAVSRTLLKAGADKDARNMEGDTPLHVAVLRGREALVRALVAAGADREVKNRGGDTPLSLAQMRGHKALVALLTQHGVD